MKKKFLFFMLIAVFSFTFVSMYGTYNIIGIVQAEDDEDEEDEEEDEKKVVRTEIVVVTPGRTVTVEQKQAVTLKDTDRDGFADEEDPHPNVAEIYVVKDEDGNGISDIWDGLLRRLTQIRSDE